MKPIVTAVASAFTWDVPSFIPFMNSMYATASQMQANVQYLTVSEAFIQTSINDIAFGDYELKMIPAHLWPGTTAKVWCKHSSKARESLMLVENNETIEGRIIFDDDDRTNSPVNRCDLMDALIRKCFTTPAFGETLPGIPIVFDVSSKPATDKNRHLHDIVFHWVLHEENFANPVKLYFTMICPYHS